MIKSAFISALLITVFSTAALAGPKCTCRFQGENYQIGEVACILGQLKQCEMALNNTSWRTLSEGCPQAQLQQSKPVQAPDALAAIRATALN